MKQKTSELIYTPEQILHLKNSQSIVEDYINNSVNGIENIKEIFQENIYPGSLDDVVEIIQTQVGITCSKDKKPVLATYGVASCISLIGYEPNLKRGFLAHLDSLTNEVSQTIVGNLSKFPENQNYELCLIGGNSLTNKDYVQKIIDSFTKNHFNSQIKFKIVKNDLFKDDESGSKSGALDTRTGKIYEYDAIRAGTNNSIKKQRKNLDKMLSLIAMRSKYYPSHLNLSYFPNIGDDN